MTNNYKNILMSAKQGKWDEAHQLVQTQSDPIAYLIHGYLHRVEGDQNNAQYWYNRANETMPDNTLEGEWDRLYALTEQINTGNN